MARQYTNTAPPLALTVAATASSTTLTVASTTGYPEPPFTLGLERGIVGKEEVALCTSKSATTFTVQRGYDGTTGTTHAIGTSVEHTVAAIDYREAAAHIEATAAHGVGVVVGTTEDQTLSGKTISGTLNTVTNLPATAITTGVLNINVIPAIPWAKLSGVPTTFAPSAHTHPVSQITGEIDATRIGGRRIWVQSAAPTTGAVNGDIWFEV